MKDFMETVQAKKNLSFAEMSNVAEVLLNDQTDEQEIAQFLKALATKGETSEEVAALVSVIRRYASKPSFPIDKYLDNCGTGGDQSNSFNISTAASFVIAAAGIRVAKHGNRKISSEAGSHDVLEDLGIPNDLTESEMTGMMAATGMTFLFAPEVHPRLKRISKIRRQIEGPTIFNLIGPLTNPVPLHAQYTGINRSEFIMEYATVANLLGRKRAIIVSGAGGLDEATLAGKNSFVLVDHGDLLPFTLTPDEVGLESAGIESIKGKDAKSNATIIRAVVAGVPGPHLDTVAFNAGVGFFAHGAVSTIREGVAFAKELIQNGKAEQQLANTVNYCRGLRSEMIRQ